MPTADLSELIERVEKLAKEADACAVNSKRVVDLLQPELDRFNTRKAPWNTYVVRMAVDHESGARREAQTAADLREVLALLRSLQHQEPRDDR